VFKISIVLCKTFSKKRLQKTIDNLASKQIVEFSYFNNLGGLPREKSAFLTHSEDVEYLGKGYWRKL